MAGFDVFRLVPRGAFHFGLPGVGLEASGVTCPSDTLSSAVFCAALLAGRIGDGATPAHLRFRLASALPYAGATLLFPLPRLKPSYGRELQAGERKRLKKLRYVSYTILRHLLEGGSLLDVVPDDAGSGGGLLLQGGEVLVAREEDPGLDPTTALEPDRLWQLERVDHVTVDRAGSASQYYAVGQVHFRAGCGLYVLAQCDDDQARAQLTDLLTELGHAGLGGRRSKGLGQFEVRRDDALLELPDSQGATRAMLLSRYIPTADELRQGVLGDGAAYDLTRVAGWLFSPGVPAQVRKTMTLLTEGSILRCPDARPPQGQVVDVRPDNAGVPHPVWRDGRALTIGVAAQEAA